jgi:hypothetical protein
MRAIDLIFLNFHGSFYCMLAFMFLAYLWFNFIHTSNSQKAKKRVINVLTDPWFYLDSSTTLTFKINREGSSPQNVNTCVNVTIEI